MASTKETALTAASPAEDTMAESTVPAKIASNASIIMGIVNLTKALFVNKGDLTDGVSMTSSP